MDNKGSIEHHFQRQRDLLLMEYEYEKSEFERLSGEQGVMRRVARGQCWFPVRLGRSYYNSLNRFVVEVARDEVADEVDSAFEYGCQVRFFYEALDGKIIYRNFPAMVSFCDGCHMAVVLPSTSALKEIDGVARLGVDLAFDETSFAAMREALDDVASAKGSRLAELRDVLCGFVAPGFRELQPMMFPWLNASQQRAVNKTLCCRDVMVVHGPPGTGKTTTLVEAVYETLRREPQVMVCAQSNAAVDWICGKLIDRGVPVLRVGNPARVDDKVLSATYERQFEAHPDYPELWGVRKAIREVAAGRRRMSRADASALSNRLHNLRRRAVELEVKIQVEIFESARVVASTLVGSDNAVLKGRRFTTLYIDEAGQALEAACWIAIRKADRVIFAGDHCQLPPTVKSVEAERAGLSRSLMESVVDKCRSAVELLTVQYRMNEAIMRFSSDWFYGGRLQAAEEVKCRGILDFDSPVEWLDTSEMDFSEKYVSATGGRVNPDEGEFMLDSLEAYIKRIGEKRVEDENLDFAVISPYKAQVSWLRRNAKKRKVLRRLKGKIAINTIDGFQGQERDVVFISLVRSNDDGKIGFLSDLRRMNVAMTRARMKLVIIGSAATLTRHPFYEKLFLSQKKENGVKKVSEISDGESMCCEKS
ncbi:MAG: helicase [Porphyromonadaceae bacterium]|nr:helicase [Porphyromonadaceae bacterium]